MSKVVVALGGNALQKKGELATAQAQLDVIRATANYLADMIEEGYELVIAHGNGPQVGRIVIQNETSKHVTPSMPLDVCDGMSQGMIGYHIEQALDDALNKRKLDIPVACLVTQVLVDENDVAFRNPTKPIGPFYTKEEADEMTKQHGFMMVEDAGRGYRRVVPSPDPLRIIELKSIKSLVDIGHIVITVGGGGIPVIKKEDGRLEGVSAVIDKDLASERLAEDIDADTLLILTSVEKVSLNFGKDNQVDLARITVADAEKYMEEGHFAPGSMLPKVQAAVRFAKSKEGRRAIIASLGNAKEALKGKTGTIITM